MKSVVGKRSKVFVEGPKHVKMNKTYKEDRWGWKWVEESAPGYRRIHDNFFITSMTLYDHEKHSVEAMKNASKLTWADIVKKPKQQTDCDKTGVGHHMTGGAINSAEEHYLDWPDLDSDERDFSSYKAWRLHCVRTQYYY
jgi:hypothetical protein